MVKSALARVDEKGPTFAAPPSSTAIAPPGPDASQVAAAAQMAPGERNNMIESMVARLAQRMAENGSDVDGWLRLIKAYTVLGERDKALTAAASARTALAGDSDNLRRIGELTKELGLEGS
jgi:cytochrome c-type biogenesis protein CcmH